ncbi:MAG: inositol monophosphatase [Planctomycetaceae bacterium]|nr:inositol monophosphatase [Planctomycetaceae bacterium]
MQLPDTLLSQVAELAREAGRFLLSCRDGISIAEKGGAHNLVTQADLDCENLLCERLAEILPHSQFLREEGGATGDHSSLAMWIIDPLDGTNNYVHGIPQFCVSIGLACAGELELGVVYDPNRDELFTAQRGCGAFLNGNPIQVSERPNLQNSVIATGFYYDRGDLVKRTLAAIGRLFDEPIRGIRRFGSAALDLCWVACGRYDGYFEYRLGAWDYAAGAVIVREAGGQCCDREGQPLVVHSGNVIASSPQIHVDLVRVVRW